jgi:uncharacterized protein YndB with AHSA1/START domain
MADTEFEVDKDKLEVRIKRLFDATPERMWKAYTDPADLAQWWDNTKIETNDVRVGGKWRYVSTDDDGKVHAFRGEFKELEEPRKIVRTFEYEPWAGHVMTETVMLEPRGDNRTAMTTISKYANLDDLEGMVNSGMERGATAGLDRLAKLVEE